MGPCCAAHVSRDSKGKWTLELVQTNECYIMESPYTVEFVLVVHSLERSQKLRDVYMGS